MSDLLTLSIADDLIKTQLNNIENSINTGELPEKTIANMEAEADSNWHLAIINDRFTNKYTFEIWKGNVHVAILATYNQ